MDNKKIILEENERLDDLQYNGLYLIQNKSEYCFTSDAVLLANLVKAKPSEVIVDFCSGSGIVGILAQAKTRASKLYLVEMQDQLAKMSQKSLDYNNLNDKVVVINDKVQNVEKYFKDLRVDVVVCNPPYKMQNSSLLNEKYEIAICKHEITITLEEIIYQASKILKFGGKFYIVNKEERLTDIIVLMKKYGIEPKIITLQTSNKGSGIIVVEGKRGGKSGIKINVIKE